MADTPRHAATYRGARRNATRNEWQGYPAIYWPYKTKPDRFRLVKLPDGKVARERYERPQPRQYPAGWRTPAERAARVLQFEPAVMALAA